MGASVHVVVVCPESSERQRETERENDEMWIFSKILEKFKQKVQQHNDNVKVWYAKAARIHFGFYTGRTEMRQSLIFIIGQIHIALN